MIFAQQNEIGAALDVGADDADLCDQHIGLTGILPALKQQFIDFVKTRRNLCGDSVIQAAFFLGLQPALAQLDLGFHQIDLLAEKLVGLAQVCRQVVDFPHVILPEDMAAGILYLASDAAGWVTGQCLVIDGGELCG